jgi:hypothetical protein
MPGDFHDEMIGALEDPGIEFLEVIGFRGCSKTTWGSLSLADCSNRAAIKVMITEHKINGDSQRDCHLGKESRYGSRLADISSEQKRIELSSRS